MRVKLEELSQAKQIHGGLVQLCAASLGVRLAGSFRFQRNGCDDMCLTESTATSIPPFAKPSWRSRCTTTAPLTSSSRAGSAGPSPHARSLQPTDLSL